jgi:hypothetical protein
MDILDLDKNRQTAPVNYYVVFDSHVTGNGPTQDVQPGHGV